MDLAKNFSDEHELGKALRAFRQAENFARLAGKKNISAALQLEIAMLSTEVGVSNSESAFLLINAIKRMEESDPSYNTSEAVAQNNMVSKKVNLDVTQRRTVPTVHIAGRPA